MAMAQKMKEAEITEQDSMLLTRNLLRIAVFNISYIRGLFPESYFNDKSVPALEMKIKKLMPMDAESRRLIDWMEKGVYDALQKKYLKTLLFCICEEIDGRTIEEYSFSFSYPCSKSEEVCMNINRNGSRKNSLTVKSNTPDITPEQMRSSACKMVRTLVSLMRTLDRMPEERVILMKLFYYEDVTPDDYEPPFFRSCSENEARNSWLKNPLKMEVGNVNSKHVVLALKVKSILDPCEDENDLPEDEEVSLGDDSVQGDEYSSDSEVHPSLADKFIVAPIGKNKLVEDNGTISEDETQDAACEDEMASQIKQWLNSRHITTIDTADILANFPDISMELTEDIVERLLREGAISRAGKDNYTVNKEICIEACFVKQKVEMQETVYDEKMPKNTDGDYMYMKALYHALPMDYVTVGKLQNKLEGEVNQNTVRKLIEKMAKDGYVESTTNRRLGKRVIHSESSNRKLMELKEILEQKSTVPAKDQQFVFNGADLPPNDQNMRDASTLGGLHSIGSDLTRAQGRGELSQNGEEERPQGQERGSSTPVSKTAPIASIESTVLGERIDGRRRTSCGGEECHSTQEKKSRKASTVKEPIIQYVKRQKSVK